MSMSRNGLTVVVSLTVLGLFGIGCAAATQRKVMETERLLAASGFQMRIQDSHHENENMKMLPQREIFPEQRDGQTYFVYADEEFCHCIYVGTAEAYQRFSQMSIEKEISEKRLRAARTQANAALSWGAWGPWYRPWY